MNEKDWGKPLGKSHYRSGANLHEMYLLDEFEIVRSDDQKSCLSQEYSKRSQAQKETPLNYRNGRELEIAYIIAENSRMESQILEGLNFLGLDVEEGEQDSKLFISNSRLEEQKKEIVDLRGRLREGQEVFRIFLRLLNKINCKMVVKCRTVKQLIIFLRASEDSRRKERFQMLKRINNISQQFQRISKQNEQLKIQLKKQSDQNLKHQQQKRKIQQLYSSQIDKEKIRNEKLQSELKFMRMKISQNDDLIVRKERQMKKLSQRIDEFFQESYRKNIDILAYKGSIEQKDEEIAKIRLQLSDSIQSSYSSKQKCRILIKEKEEMIAHHTQIQQNFQKLLKHRIEEKKEAEIETGKLLQINQSEVSNGILLKEVNQKINVQSEILSQSISNLEEINSNLTKQNQTLPSLYCNSQKENSQIRVLLEVKHKTELKIQKQLSLCVFEWVQEKFKLETEVSEQDDCLKQFELAEKDVGERYSTFIENLAVKTDLTYDEDFLQHLQKMKQNKMAQIVAKLLKQNMVFKKCLMRMIQNEAKKDEEDNYIFFNSYALEIQNPNPPQAQIAQQIKSECAIY